MDRRPSISAFQLGLLAAGSAIMFPYTFLPILRTGPANQDVWIVLLLAMVFVIILNIPMLILVNKFKNFDLVEINETIVGKPVGKITAMFFVLYPVFCFFACMQFTVLYVRTFLLADTPEWVILLFILIPVTYAAYKGAGTIARLASFVIPIIMLTILLFFVVGIKNMDLEFIMPIMKDSTFLQIAEGAFFTAARFSEILIIVVFSIYLRKGHKVNSAYFIGLLVFGISFFILTIATLLVLGPGLAKLSLNPFLIYTRQVGGQDFLQRVQIFNFVAWFTGTLIKLTIFNYIATFLFSKIIGKKTYKPFVVPLSILGFVACMMPFLQKTSTLHMLNEDTVFPFIVLSVTLIVPLILLIVYLFRMKEVNQKIEQRNQSVTDVANPTDMPQ